MTGVATEYHVGGTFSGGCGPVRVAPLEPAAPREPAAPLEAGAAPEPAAPDGFLRIAFAVDLDFGRVGEMTSVIRNTLRRHAPHAPRALQVDLSRVDFLDCAGVSGLLACQAEAAAIGCRLTVCHPRPIVARILRLTGTLDTLTGTLDTSRHPGHTGGRGAGGASEAGRCPAGQFPPR